MSAFYIGPEETAAIQAAIERARKRVIPMSALRSMAIPDQEKPLVTLEDRARVGEDRIDYQSEHVMLPFGYRLSVSCEEQPIGICLHFSLSSPNAGRVPHPQAMAMVMQTAGVPQKTQGHSWFEEFLVDGKPGGLAINCVVVVEKQAGGDA